MREQIFAHSNAISKNVHSVAVARLRVFTQPRPISEVALPYSITSSARASSLADLGSSQVQSVEGGYSATVAETGPEEPDVLIVPGARFYDLVPVRELPYGPAAPSLHQRPDRWQHPTTCQSSSKNRLHLEGRPQMSTRPSLALIP